MYVPHFNAVDDELQIRAFVRAANVAQWVTVDADGSPLATLLPVIWAGDRLLTHLARANPQWQSIRPGSTGLAIVSGPDAYISPGWYAAKAEHGRVVPTWNYTAVHLTGPMTVHHDPEWLLGMVSALTDRYESDRSAPWAVSDAPERYLAGQLKAIVGIELQVQRIEGKAKLSQNRSEADRAGVIAGLRAEDDRGAEMVAEAMAAGTMAPPT